MSVLKDLQGLGHLEFVLQAVELHHLEQSAWVQDVTGGGHLVVHSAVISMILAMM